MSKDYRDKHPVCLVKPGEKEHFQFWCDGEWVTYFPDRTAFFLHLQGIPWSTDEPLPEGVFRASDGRLLATCEVATRLAALGGWTAHNTSGVGGPLNTATIAWTSTIVEVRRAPEPKTERVPWWESVGRIEFTQGHVITHAISTEEDVRLYYEQNGERRYLCDPELDGMVEVLPTDPQDGER